MRRRSWIVLIACILRLAPTAAAFACTCDTRPTGALIKDANLVVIGTVMAVEARADDHTAAIAVRQVFKGTTTESLSVRTEPDPSACGVPFVVGQRYAIFASDRDGEVRTSLCSGTTDQIGILADARYERPRPNGRSAAVAASGARSRTVPITAAAILLVGAAGSLIVGSRRRRVRGDDG